MWLVASSELTDLAVIRDGKPALWRDLRRFNAPIQLAVGAAHEVITRAVSPTEAAIISLAPCQSGSPEVHRWIRETAEGGTARVNPTYTLHCVDNLALSVLSIGIKNHAWAMSLGGASGMAWSALELALERDEREVLVFGGDQVTPYEVSPIAAFAMLFAREMTAHVTTGRPTRLVGVDRQPKSHATHPHAASGMIAMLAALRSAPIGHFAYVVPAADSDGRDEIVVRWEVLA